MKILNKVSSFSKKIIRGESPVKIKYNEMQWDEQFKKGNWDFLLRDHENIVLVTNILHNLAAKKEGKLKILDVGCGNGALASKLNRDVIGYFGADISQAAVDEAQERVKWGTFVQSNMDVDLPFSSEQFDVVLFCEVLIYVDYEHVLERYSRLLRTDGLYLISLYDVWRTKIIWRRIIGSLDVITSVFVKNKTRNVGWNILLGRYKK